MRCSPFDPEVMATLPKRTSPGKRRGVCHTVSSPLYYGAAFIQLKMADSSRVTDAQSGKPMYQDERVDAPGDITLRWSLREADLSGFAEWAGFGIIGWRHVDCSRSK